MRIPYRLVPQGTLSAFGIHLVPQGTLSAFGIHLVPQGTLSAFGIQLVHKGDSGLRSRPDEKLTAFHSCSR